jgi:hypothetical protein
MRETAVTPQLPAVLPALVCRQGNHLGCHDLQFLLGKGVCDPGLHLGGHAMAMNVPPRARMFEKASPRRHRELAPNALGVRTNGVDDAAPVAPLGHMRIDPAPEPSEQLPAPLPEGNIRLFDTHRLDTSVGRRQQAASRHRNDRPPMSIP